MIRIPVVDEKVTTVVDLNELENVKVSNDQELVQSVQSPTLKPTWENKQQKEN